MTFDQMVNMIAVLLGNRPNLKGRIENKAEFVKEFTLEGDPEFQPWFLLNEDQTIATVADQAYVNIPADFITEYEYGFLENTNGCTILKGEFDKLKAANASTTEGVQTSGEPSRYAMVGLRMYLFPVPDAVYNLPIRYFAKTAVFAESKTDNPWLLFAGDWILNATAKAVAKDLQNDAKAKELATDTLVSRARVLAKHHEDEAKNIGGYP